MTDPFDRNVVGPAGVFGGMPCYPEQGEERVDTPVGQRCMLCREVVQDGDQGLVGPVWEYQGVLVGGQITHRECGLRSAVGGIGHCVDHARYCHSDLGPDAGLGYRESALLVWEWFGATAMRPSDEQTEAWKQRVDVRRATDA